MIPQQLRLLKSAIIAIEVVYFHICSPFRMFQMSIQVKNPGSRHRPNTSLHLNKEKETHTVHRDGA